MKMKSMGPKRPLSMILKWHWIKDIDILTNTAKVDIILAELRLKSDKEKKTEEHGCRIFNLSYQV
jgi:hypothetical protein